MFNKIRNRKESDNVKEELDLEIKEDYRKKNITQII
ncbi:unknown [Clostridium sp. CAG:594]|nr:unknown [Clostridium sp. CAG:594]